MANFKRIQNQMETPSIRLGEISLKDFAKVVKFNGEYEEYSDFLLLHFEAEEIEIETVVKNNGFYKRTNEKQKLSLVPENCKIRLNGEFATNFLSGRKMPENSLVRVIRNNEFLNFQLVAEKEVKKMANFKSLI